MTRRLPSPLREDDYLAIESAVMETARGRWFLAEYAARHRAADTQTVLDAIDELGTAVKRERELPAFDRVRLDLVDMAQAIERTKGEIAELTQDGGTERIGRATVELDAIVAETEAATSTILTAAEAIQEAAWTMREDGADTSTCDDLDTLATDIYQACSFQDLTGQRIRKVIGVLGFLEHRINAMMEAWGIDAAAVRPAAAREDAALLNGPALAGEGLAQSAIDDLIEVDDPDIEWAPDPEEPEAVAEAPAPVPEPPAPPPVWEDDLVMAVDPEIERTVDTATQRLRALHERMLEADLIDPTAEMSREEKSTLFS